MDLSTRPVCLNYAHLPQSDEDRGKVCVAKTLSNRGITTSLRLRASWSPRHVSCRKVMKMQADGILARDNLRRSPHCFRESVWNVSSTPKACGAAAAVRSGRCPASGPGKQGAGSRPLGKKARNLVTRAFFRDQSRNPLDSSSMRL